MSDWRLQGQERFLAGVRLYWIPYRPSRQSEHEHCEFCSRQFSADPEDLNEGYATKDRYHWVCQSCYDDFREQFKWTLGTD
jgi:transposase-like protein